MHADGLVLIANPAAGGGRGRRLVADARRALLAAGPVLVRETEAAGDEERLVREALHAGHRRIAVLGGDGTWSRVAATLAAEGAGRCTALALLAAGSGNDFAKSLDAPARDFDATARLLRDGATRPADMATAGGRWFANSVGFGFDARVVHRIAGERSLVGGHARYVATALVELFGYEGVRVAVDGGAPTRQLALVVANGGHFGGSFLIAPPAAPDDATLDLVTIGAASSLRRLALFTRAARGLHLSEPEVAHRAGASFTLRFDAPPAYQADGEAVTADADELEVRVVPGALRVVAPARAEG